MAEVNSLECLIGAGNTGIGTCTLDFRNIIGAFLTPKGYELTKTQVAALQASLIAAAQADAAGDRIYPIMNFVANTDASESLTVQSTNYGFKFPVREGVNDWSFQYVQGGLCLHKELRKSNGANHDFLFVDADMKIMGTTGSADGYIKAIPNVYFWAHPWKANDGTKVSEYLLQFVFPPRYINEFVSFVKADFDIPSTVLGLKTVKLTNPSANATPGSYNVKANEGCVGDSLFDLYDDELAVVGMWTAKDKVTGNPITITGVTKNTSFGGWVIAVNTADPDYVGSGGGIEFNLAAPSVLADGGVEGYESLGVVIIDTNGS